ncbi:MAG: hypothetical protein V4699_02965 [Patescibacteria group bacterium]
MLDMDKNLKDSADEGQIVVKDTFLSISYTKTNKLITALYMVTDIVDKDEPLRNKLRTLGAEILSDIHSTPANAHTKITQVMSFLDLSSAVNIISEMNCAILKKEFLELKGSIHKSKHAKPIWLEEFLEVDRGEGEARSPLFSKHPPFAIGQNKSKGHAGIGVQKGSTLLRALSNKKLLLSDTNSIANSKESFDVLKKQRRNIINTIIKNNGGSATIKDIKMKMDTEDGKSLISSEKTLQRELVSMTKDGVLNRTGEKRWSRYFIK